MTPRYTAIENIVRKEENTSYKDLLLFLQCFPPFPKQNLIYH